MKISFVLNGKTTEINTEPWTRVIDILREQIHLTGTKEGCGSGDCGACTIVVDGESKLACLMYAMQLEGRNIETIEGLKKDGVMHPIQEAFVDYGAVQCGFCIPGMIMAVYAFLQKNHRASRKKIKEAISGNLCRCTGYEKIVDAVEAVAKNMEKRKKKPLSLKMPQKHSGINPFLPERLDELWRLIDGGSDISVYAGGTDLLVKLRENSPSKKIKPICLERMKELKTVYESEEGIFIGACSTHSELLHNPKIQRRFPVLIKALKSLGSPSIRNMGTIGGNICTASPAGDTLPPLYVLDAKVEIRSKAHRRLMPIREFILGPGRTALEKGEILYGVWLDRDINFNIHHFEKIGQREALTISIASLAALLKLSEDGTVEEARFAWGSVGPTVVRSKEVEDGIIGRPFNRETLRDIVSVVHGVISPIDDIRSSAVYRKKLAGNLLFRLLK
ncbi:MAG: FAD binding domain-containing protein [Syntrophorhabdaceae bacterium]|nr:FAD binding domain-containing protein [Syntrophorhabdaceae bacterium]